MIDSISQRAYEAGFGSRVRPGAVGEDEEYQARLLLFQNPTPERYAAVIEIRVLEVIRSSGLVEIYFNPPEAEEFRPTKLDMNMEGHLLDPYYLSPEFGYLFNLHGDMDEALMGGIRKVSKTRKEKPKEKTGSSKHTRGIAK